MNKISKSMLAVMLSVTLASGASGQLPDLLQGAATAAPGISVATMQAAGHTDSPSAACAYPFTIPGTATKQFLQYCVSPNGNIVEFQSPEGYEHIAVGAIGEGYALCDRASGIGYLDYGDYGDFDTGHWGAPVLLNLTAAQVKIARTTTDGNWTLTQTFVKSAADSTVKVTMALTNNTGAERYVWLTRLTDVDADSTLPNTMDGTRNTAFGYTSSAGLGMQLILPAASPYSHGGWAEESIDRACNVGSGHTGTLIGVDGVNYFIHGISIKAGKTGTVSFKYKGI